MPRRSGCDPKATFSFIVPMLLKERPDDVSDEEWWQRWKARYARVREHLPQAEALLEAVESFDCARPVRWVNPDGTPFDPETAPDGCEARALVEPRNKATRADIAASLRLARQAECEPERKRVPADAGELLALLLRFELVRLKGATRSKRAGVSTRTPVRDNNMLPRSVIAECAFDLLEDCETRRSSPGPELLELVRELLDLPVVTADPKFEARYVASWILAQAPVGVRSLAKNVGVSPSTVVEWRRDPAFNDQVALNRHVLEHFEAEGSSMA